MTNLGNHFWKNGTFESIEKAQAPLMSHGFHYGTGVFEGIRAYKTKKGYALFRAMEHYERLHFSASVIELSIAFSPKDLVAATLELLRKNNFGEDSIYIRPNAFFGTGKIGLNPTGAQEEVFILAWPWGAYISDNPIAVGTAPYIRIHPNSLNCEAKICGHYINSIISNQWAHKNNFEEALMLDYEGNLAEGSGENLFLLKDGVLFTPKRGSILPGITRETIIQLADEKFGIKTLEKTLKMEDLLMADEAFFTGTAAEVTLLKSVDGHQIGDQKNPVSQDLKDLYSRVVRGEVPEYLDWLDLV